MILDWLTPEMKRMWPGTEPQLYNHLDGPELPWRKLGAAKHLGPDEPVSLMMWPDSGDFKWIEDHRWSVDERRDAVLFGDRADDSWSVCKRGKYQGLSLPQAFFLDPIGLMKEYMAQEFEGLLHEEASEIWSKCQAIAPGRTKNRDAIITQRFDLRWGYCGISNGPSTLSERHCGLEVIDNVIDAAVHCEPWIGYAPAQNSQALSRAIMNAVDAYGPRNWDRVGCESFFNDSAYFS